MTADRGQPDCRENKLGTKSQSKSTDISQLHEECKECDIQSVFNIIIGINTFFFVNNRIKYTSL